MLQTISHDYNVSNAAQNSISATNISVLLKDEQLCFDERRWMIFVMSSTVTFYICLFTILMWRLCVCVYVYLCCCKEPAKISTEKKIQMPDLKVKKKNSQYQASISAKVLMVVALVSNIASFILYLVDISNHKYVEWCTTLNENTTLQIDLAFNLIFIVFFFIRFMEKPNKLLFVTNIHTFIDYLTIPPFILSLYLQHTWIGFRFLRVMHIMSIPDIFIHLNILKKSNSIYCVQVFVINASATILAAGVIHLLENYGDPWNFENAQQLSYWTCIYIALLPPLGFNYCRTMHATIFLVFYLLCYLVLCGALIKDMLMLRAKKSNVKKSKVNQKLMTQCSLISLDSKY